jgi:chloramphenicol-sensitive protein RarD
MDRKEYMLGLIYGGSSFVIWGLLPLYWKLLGVISPYQVFSHRVVWSFLFLVLVLIVRGKGYSFLTLMKDKKNWLNNFGPAFFISINWLVFIWSVDRGYVIEASLGYYINPLVLTTLGAVFFKERLTRLQAIGLGFAASGVLIKSIVYGKIPIIALTLALAFGTYGLLKKKSKLTSLEGLAFETMIISVPAIAYVVFAESTGIGITGNLPWQFWLTISTTGVITAIPLLLFAEGTKRLPLSVVGFLQFIGPTLMLVLGIFVFGEVFDQSSIIAFTFIWIGLVFFSYSQYKLLTK